MIKNGKLFIEGQIVTTSNAVITPVQLGYLSGVTSSIQTQINNKTDKTAMVDGRLIFKYEARNGVAYLEAYVDNVKVASIPQGFSG